ncbi:hypothetical protein SAMN04487846_1727 [Microbacterium sp. cf046]|uniref:hypothetical protein n=1 Tax=Microbacterium sp. cf046 TaxID=1761803 RepID=UPI0008E2953E|nr:hypothetical protein [Microbacterium sp. cf046]SFS03941.1 hypothetical protein SAMN04487846_1727 [Microbacterium sp. cf046]
MSTSGPSADRVPGPPSSRFGGWAAIVFSLAALVWFGTEASVAAIGGIDADDAVATLAFVTAHPLPWNISGFALIGMALALIPASLAASDALSSADRASAHLGARSLAALGVITAALFFFMGVLRETAGPLAYIAEIDATSGVAAAAALVVVGAHGAAQGAVFAMCIWAVGIGILGLRTRTLPVWLCVLAVIPAVRIVILLLGPLGALPDWTWFIAVAVIPLTLLWPLALGIALLRLRRSGSGRAG